MAYFNGYAPMALRRLSLQCRIRVPGTVSTNGHNVGFCFVLDANSKLTDVRVWLIRYNVYSLG